MFSQVTIFEANKKTGQIYQKTGQKVIIKHSWLHELRFFVFSKHDRIIMT